MKNNRSIFLSIAEQMLPWCVLVFIAWYIFVKFALYPYVGFRWDMSSQVNFVFEQGNMEQPLAVGDRLLQVGSVPWDAYKENLWQPLIDGLPAGQVIQLQIERNGQQINIPWTLPGPNRGEISNLVWNEGWLAIVFWFLGTATLLNIRPKNDLWALLVAFNYLTAIWLTVGSGLSILHVWGSAVILRVFVWLCVPVYLHLHWVFPKPLGKLHPTLIWVIYLMAVTMSVAQIFQLIPQNFYYLGFVSALAGSFILLLLHIIRQPETRGELRILFLAGFFSFAPSIAIGLLDPIIQLPVGVGGLGLLSLPLLPLGYFYVAKRRQLGEFELRFNQGLFIYIYLIMLLVISLPILGWANTKFIGFQSAIIIGISAVIVTGLVTIFGHRILQVFFERMILGMSLPTRDLLELYTDRITASTSFPGLQEILEYEILPRLHVRQFAFLQVEQDNLRLLSLIGARIDPKILDTEQIVTIPVGKYITPGELGENNEMFPWVRVSLELKIGTKLLGIWLFGRRDPDDFYSHGEISLLQLLANQTAIAMSNILQTERVMEMYQQDIGRHEEERLRLALDLHDSILNQLAALLMHLDDNAISPEFQAAYDQLSNHLREIVTNLRPPMLSYGLKPAIDELVDNLLDRYEELNFTVKIEASEIRYDPRIEQHIFRIIQEASENALRHGRATVICIDGYLRSREIFLQIQDNGMGFDGTQGFDLDDLLSRKHFGLAGMLERAHLIGGDVRIRSKLDTGTQVQVIWQA